MFLRTKIKTKKLFDMTCRSDSLLPSVSTQAHFRRSQWRERAADRHSFRRQVYTILITVFFFIFKCFGSQLKRSGQLRSIHYFDRRSQTATLFGDFVDLPFSFATELAKVVPTFKFDMTLSDTISVTTFLISCPTAAFFRSTQA